MGPQQKHGCFVCQEFCNAMYTIVANHTILLSPFYPFLLFVASFFPSHFLWASGFVMLQYLQFLYDRLYWYTH